MTYVWVGRPDVSPMWYVVICFLCSMRNYWKSIQQTLFRLLPFESVYSHSPGPKMEEGEMYIFQNPDPVSWDMQVKEYSSAGQADNDLQNIFSCMLSSGTWFRGATLKDRQNRRFICESWTWIWCKLKSTRLRRQENWKQCIWSAGEVGTARRKGGKEGKCLAK